MEQLAMAPSQIQETADNPPHFETLEVFLRRYAADFTNPAKEHHVREAASDLWRALRPSMGISEESVQGATEAEHRLRHLLEHHNGGTEKHALIDGILNEIHAAAGEAQEDHQQEEIV